MHPMTAYQISKSKQKVKHNAMLDPVLRKKYELNQKRNEQLRKAEERIRFNYWWSIGSEGGRNSYSTYTKSEKQTETKTDKKEITSKKEILDELLELADKLEFLKKAAEEQGFTLEDVINEATEKEETNGGIQKKLSL